MILDELIEKKDILIYIDMRSKVLDQEIKKELEITIPKNREKILQRYVGRKKELKLLRGVVHDGNVKEQGKVYWRSLPKEITLPNGNHDGVKIVNLEDN